MKKVTDGTFEFEDTEIDIIVGALRLLAQTHRDERVPQAIEDIIYDKNTPPRTKEEHEAEALDFDQMADELMDAAPPRKPPADERMAAAPPRKPPAEKTTKKYTVSYDLTLAGLLEVETDSAEAAEEIVQGMPIDELKGGTCSSGASVTIDDVIEEGVTEELNGDEDEDGT
jgi:hypothetical protein